ncbi:hypothetical protein XENOCAPTIV_006561 [Xenoophorus captivus]|uniref:Uncharacterized protein n=1 Tax=Xenoophorus captivus TaxID=1517983 RepID=A0ABV0S1L2_9TELE
MHGHRGGAGVHLESHHPRCDGAKGCCGRSVRIHGPHESSGHAAGCYCNCRYHVTQMCLHLRNIRSFILSLCLLLIIQISRLEETWTTLRRNYTQTAISYEKILKPFYKSLYEGEGVELWETSDQGCDIMLRHLEAARDIANNAQSYTSNAVTILKGKGEIVWSVLFSIFLSDSRKHVHVIVSAGFQCDEDLLEVFKTDFQLRLLWGSRGAAVNQSDRYNKFNLILTALSRKLEPTTKTQAVI